MKKIVYILIAVAMMICFAACGGNSVPKDDGVVDDFVIDGEEVSAKDFVIESCNKYIAGEQYRTMNKTFTEYFGESMDFAVTRVIDLKAYGLGQTKMDIHYLLIKTECNWAKEENGEILSSDNLLLVADYDTGTVWSEFDADEAWLSDGETKEYWTYNMLNGPLVGSAYKGGAILSNDIETRSEFSEEDIAEINAALIQ